ncbi:MAG: carboxyl transferase domain-containing protein, partial [Pseudomonadota bacterium]|nr:carboxyl transferase domain-containing protein [Pseudomonadota bacterium]
AARRTREDLTLNTTGDGVVTGLGTVNGDLFAPDRARTAFAICDYMVLAGTQGQRHHRKLDRIFSVAKREKMPLVLFAEGGGGRPGDTERTSISGLISSTFATFAGLSGQAPLVGVVSGRCFAGNAALLGCCDVIIADESSNIGMAGPAMIEGGGLGVFSPEEVGPIDLQSKNGVVDLRVKDEAEAAEAARRYLSYFQGDLETFEHADQRLLREAIPENRLRVHDIRGLIETLCDKGSVLELRREFGLALVTCLVRIGGKAFGLIANDCRHLSGAIDAPAADKAARFLQLCDTFGLPIVSLCDTPGFMVGPEAEKTALVRHVCRMFVAAASLSTPMFSVVVRKGYGLGAMAMTGGAFHESLFTVSWPTGEYGGMGLEGGVRLGYRKEFDALETPEEKQALYEELVAKAYEIGKATSVATTAEIDAVIDPATTRDWILAGLRSCAPRAPGARATRSFIDPWCAGLAAPVARRSSAGRQGGDRVAGQLRRPAGGQGVGRRGEPHGDHDQPLFRRDDHGLSGMARGEIGSRRHAPAAPGARALALAAIGPETGAVAGAGLRGRTRRPVGPARGQQAAPGDDAVGQEQLAQPRPVPRRSEDMGAGHGRAGLIEFLHRPGHAGGGEQQRAGGAGNRLGRSAHQVAQDAAEDGVVAVRIGPARSGGRVEGRRGGDGGHVAFEEQHPRRGVEAVVGRPERLAGGLAQKLLGGDGRMRVAGAPPGGDRSGGGRLDAPGQRQGADQGVGHGLGHRPARQPAVRAEAGRVALGDHGSVMHDHHRAAAAGRGALRLCEGPVQGRGQRRRGGRDRGVGQAGQQARPVGRHGAERQRRRVNRPVDQRAAPPGGMDRAGAEHPGEAGGHRLPLPVRLPRGERRGQRAEGGGHVAFEQGIGVGAGHEGFRAQRMRREAGRHPSRLVRRAAGEQRGRGEGGGAAGDAAAATRRPGRPGGGGRLGHGRGHGHGRRAASGDGAVHRAASCSGGGGLQTSREPPPGAALSSTPDAPDRRCATPTRNDGARAGGTARARKRGARTSAAERRGRVIPTRWFPEAWR